MTGLQCVDRTNVAAIIPAYREEKHIYDVVRRTLAQVDHVFVVDDGSPDQTTEKARQAGATVLEHGTNQGKGAAIKTGLHHAMAFEGVMLLDGDGQHRPEEIPRFLNQTNQAEAHLILGTRMDDAKGMPIARKLTNRMLSWHISFLCGQTIPDTQCGFRLIRRDLALHFFCESNAYEYETEMLFIAARKGYRIVSVPVSTVYADEESKIRPVRDTIRFLRLIRRYQRIRS
jgi:glycosyltransferase involved in cell wall biosynthesis